MGVLCSIAGAALIIIGGIMTGNSPYEATNADFLSIQNAMYLGFIAVGALLILLGISGKCAGFKKSRCCSVIFAILALIVGIVALAIGVAIFVQIDYLQQQYDEDGCTKGVFKDLQDASNAAAENYCTDVCACDADSSIVNTTGLVTDVDGATSVDKCGNWSDFATDDMDTNKDYFKWMEEKFECSGICDVHQTYLWVDINTEPQPDDACIQQFLDYMKNEGQIYGGSLVAGGVIFILLGVFGFCMCCKAKNEDDDKGYSNPNTRAV